MVIDGDCSSSLGRLTGTTQGAMKFYSLLTRGHTVLQIATISSFSPLPVCEPPSVSCYAFVATKAAIGASRNKSARWLIVVVTVVVCSLFNCLAGYNDRADGSERGCNAATSTDWRPSPPVHCYWRLCRCCRSLALSCARAMC